MSTAVWTNRFEMTSVADTTLKAAARFWFVVSLAGQLVFAFAVATFYGLSALRGDYHGWSKSITHGHVPGDTMGNFAVAMHLASAAAIMFSGGVQLIPALRSRFPVFHRWNGRTYMLAALALSAAGMYMHWVRGSVGDVIQKVGGSLNTVLIWTFAALALRYALARDFRTHRRWALRLFIVVSGSWFYRIIFFLTFLIMKRPVGFDPTTFSGPYLTFMAFANYLLPLAILEIYLHAKDHGGAFQRMATAGLLFVVTLGMAAGLFAVTMAIWVPDVKAGFDPRISIDETLTTTIASGGIDAAVVQYYDLKAHQAGKYNFDEDQLNTLGYKMLRANKFNEAVRVLQLNVEAYAKSSNVYDSLGEAYMNAGNKPLAIANYKKSLELNPRNVGAVKMLQKMGAP